MFWLRNKKIIFKLGLLSYLLKACNGYIFGRALTPLFGNGARAHGIGKISGILTKIGKCDIVLMYDISIAGLIAIIYLTLVSYERREIKKQV